MSSKIGITPDEIITAIKALPPVSAMGGDALEAALAAMDARPPVAVQTRVVLYRFDNGPTAQADTYQAQMQNGSLPMVDVCREMDCDLQLIEIGGGETDIQDSARSAAFGMMAAEQDTGLIVVAAFGAGSVERAVQIDPKNFLETATPETAALLGAMIGGVMAKIPVIAEGVQGLMAARALHALRPDCTGGIFICGVQDNDPALHIFVDAEPSETGYAGAMLAAILLSEHAKAKAA